MFDKIYYTRGGSHVTGRMPALIRLSQIVKERGSLIN